MANQKCGVATPLLLSVRHPCVCFWVAVDCGCRPLLCCIFSFDLSRKAKPQAEEEVAGKGKKKGRPTHRYTCAFPVSVYYAAFILLWGLPPSLQHHMLPAKPSFYCQC